MKRAAQQDYWDQVRRKFAGVYNTVDVLIKLNQTKENVITLISQVKVNKCTLQ